MLLHELLTQQRDEIVRRCLERYRLLHPDTPVELLLDSIPVFIDQIIKAERQRVGIDDPSELPGPTQLARDHGEQRFHIGFELREVPEDYAQISQAIGDIAIEHGMEIDAGAYKLLDECFDAGVADSIGRYFELARAQHSKDAAESLGFLVHELRNALGSAVLAWGFIRAGKVTVQSKTAAVLERALNQLEALVSQALVEVQLGSGVAPARDPVDLTRLIDEIVAGAMPERDIRIEQKVEPRLAMVGDARLLGSAITNLLQNALKFTRAGGTVLIRAARATDGVKIEIEDECGGLKVPAQTLFQPFVQHRKKERGVGLGLAITRKAVEVHGGSLAARDLPGKGCVFAISLPPS